MPRGIYDDSHFRSEQEPAGIGCHFPAAYLSMKTTALNLEKGKQFPNLVIKDPVGQKYSLWDFRQKSHVALIYEPDSDEETVKRQLSAIEADRKQWDWLNVKVLIAEGAVPGLAPGAY